MADVLALAQTALRYERDMRVARQQADNCRHKNGDLRAEALRESANYERHFIEAAIELARAVVSQQQKPDKDQGAKE